MTVYEKARELGNMILETDEYKRLSGARYVYDSDEQAQRDMAEYSSYSESIRKKMEAGSLSEEEFNEASKKLRSKGEELKKQKVIGELIEAETSFNMLVNQIMDILKATITGQSDCDCGCSGSCGSCGGCH